MDKAARWRIVCCGAFSGLLAAGCGSGGGSGAGLPAPLPPGAGSRASGGTDEADPAAGPTHRVLAFQDVALAVGLRGAQEKGGELCNTFLGSGAAFADVDLDGDVDLFATNHGGPNFLYLQQGDTDGDGLPNFVDVATALGIEQAGHFSHAAVFIDHDNDGDQDLYVTSQNLGNTLWRNDLIPLGQLAFTDVTAFAGLADEGRAVTAAWGDLDRDGFLDVYLAKHATCFLDVDPTPPDRLYHALGDGRYEDWSRYLCADGTRTCRDVVGLGFTAAFLDSDDDADPDLYLVNDATHGGGPNRHWRNDGPDGAGGWRLPEVSAQLGTNTRLNGMGLGVGDLDNDGWLDLVFSNIEESHVLRNQGDGSYEDITYTCGVFGPTRLLTGWGTLLLDADSDGWLDMFFANGPIWGDFREPDTLLRNEGQAFFTDVSASAGVQGAQRRGRAVAQCDFDRDGYVDFLVGNLFQTPYLFHNQAGPRHSTQGWLVVTVEGTRSNRDGIGTRLILDTVTSDNGAMRQVREIGSGASHGGGDERAAFFGMGSARSGRLSVRWPTGAVQSIGLVNADQRLHLVEPPH